ncbi:MAG: riboflavin biosynthesis protein RibF [Clostridiales bacterium]|nr:riboflavin biosynthesis protein RibF [Clostridiales bacterium]
MIEKTVKVHLDTLEFMPYGRAVALGFFDGMHLGHQDIIRKMVKFAKSNGLRSTVQTFSGFPKDDGVCLTTLNERLEILSEMGVDEMLVIDFDRIRDLEPEQFFNDILRINVNAKLILSGEDYRFGKGAKGDRDLLKRLGSENDVAVKIIKEKCLEGEDIKISSTRMKEAVLKGDVERFMEFSGGRPFLYEGTVIEGKKLGRQIGFPTVNMKIPENKIVAAKGVYVSRVMLGKTTFYGVTNIGRRPTVEDSGTDLVETNIFDFDEDIYGAFIRVELLKFLRPEKAFGSVEELCGEVSKNKIQAKTYLTESGMIS